MKLSHVNLTPTMRCNLRCELCGVMVPQYEYRPEMSEQEFLETLQALFLVVDHIERLQITGGEPLMHPRLDRILELCFAYEAQFEELWLFSNCAVPLRENVLQILAAHRERVLVHCSDYGVRPEVSQRNIRLLTENEIPYRYLKYFGEDQSYGGWVDNGDFEPHHRTREENEAVFAGCSHVRWGGSWYVRHGQIHWCGRSVRGTELGKIPLVKEDYLDLLDLAATVEEKKAKLEKLKQARTITACDYCGGFYGTEDAANRRPAGRQLEVK